MKIASLVFALPLFPLLALAQTTPAAPSANLITNGGFERFSPRDNLWDGVSSEGYLAGERGTVFALSQSSVREMAMPASVAVADLNGDKLLDLMTAEPLGYYRVYFNVGTASAPAFDHAEMVPLFLEKVNEQRVPKINLFDWSNRGVADLVVGNYRGELYFLQNQGSALKPDFRQPTDLAKAVTPTSSKGLWLNLLAPAAFDLNKDGRTDLLAGEGSYSANSVHLLINKGSNARPVFDTDSRFYLAYGDGREHLTPAVADCNGDGFPDVLSSDRDGKVGIYLNPGAAWKPGDEFKLSGFLKFAAADNLGGLVSICAADLNGDNLFDLVIGKTGGRVSVAYNHGSATEPKFDAPVDLKGTDLWGRNNLVPLGWPFDNGYDRGNAYSYVSAVTAAEDAEAAPPEGKACLKVGYFPSPNKIFPVPHIIFPGDANAISLFEDIGKYAWHLPTNVVVIKKDLAQVTIGKTYTLSMKVKGSGFTAGGWTFSWKGTLESAPDKIVRGERDSVQVEKHVVNGYKKETGNLSGGAAWTTINKTFVLQKFDEPQLKPLLKCAAALEIRVTLPTTAATFYLDDVSLTAAP